jgi:small subunit ribosomal protein S7
MGRITASRKQLKPDPRHGSLLASKFINCVMDAGKKTVAEAVFYDALAEIAKRVKDVEPIEVFHQAVENVKPHIEVRSIRWLLMAIRDKKGRPTHLKLADELIAAFNKEGAAMTRRDNVHRMADANKAFAHFAW